MAQFKATVLVMPNGLLKITGLPLDTSCIECDVKIDDPTVRLSSTQYSALKFEVNAVRVLFRFTCILFYFVGLSSSSVKRFFEVVNIDLFLGFNLPDSRLDELFCLY